MTEPSTRRQVLYVVAYIVGLAVLLAPLLWVIGRLAVTPGAP